MNFQINSFIDLEQLGWRRRTNVSRKSYIRPNNRVVKQRRDLTQDEDRQYELLIFNYLSHIQTL